MVQPDENVDYCSSLECCQNLFKVLGAQPFNYTDAIDALPNSIMAFGSSERSGYGITVVLLIPLILMHEGFFNDAGAADVVGKCDMAGMVMEVGLLVGLKLPTRSLNFSGASWNDGLCEFWCF